MTTPTAELELALVHLSRAIQLCVIFPHRAADLELLAKVQRGAGEVRRRFIAEHSTTLPFQVWCRCTHISGQHGARFPHVCAVDGGCENNCQEFQEAANGKQEKIITPAF
jgi:hypothetical protein